MKRVLIFTLNYHPFIGGAEVALRELTDRLGDEYEFHAIALRLDSALPKVEQVGKVLIHRIGFARPHPSSADIARFPLHLNKHWYQVAAFFTALSLHRRYRYDLVWAMMAHSAGIPAALFKRVHSRVPYLLTLQEGDPPEHIERIMRPVFPLFRDAFRRADALQPISTFLGKWGARMGFKKPWVVIPNGVDTEAFARPQDSAAVAALRARYATKDETLLITTSRLVRKNGIDTVIDALPHSGESVKFLVLGVGADLAALRERAHALGVSERVFFEGQKEYAELPLYLAASDVFIRPSRSEGMGNSFIEAMAAGVPVIASKEGGIADFLFDREQDPGVPATGWAVPKDDPDAIARAIIRIRENSSERAETLANAKALALKDYSWVKVSEALRRLLDSLTAPA